LVDGAVFCATLDSSEMMRYFTISSKSLPQPAV